MKLGLFPASLAGRTVLLVIAVIAVAEIATFSLLAHFRRGAHVNQTVHLLAGTIGAQLQSVGIGGTERCPRVGVERRQDDLQQPYLAGEQMHRLVDMRAAAEVRQERESGDLGDGDDGDHQQHGPRGQRCRKEAQLHPATSPVESGTKT